MFHQNGPIKRPRFLEFHFAFHLPLFGAILALAKRGETIKRPPEGAVLLWKTRTRANFHRRCVFHNGAPAMALPLAALIRVDLNVPMQGETPTDIARHIPA